MQSILIPLFLALSLSPSLVAGATCYSAFRGYYQCNGALSSGARIGIGIGIAVGILALFSLLTFWKRKRVMKAWRANSAAQAQNSTLPSYNAQQPYYGAPPTMAQYPSQPNQYAPPPGAPPGSFYATNTGGVKQPQEAYRPGGAQEEHGYEYQQHLENLRRDAEGTGAVHPPGYEVSTTGGSSTNLYSPPQGPPPTRQDGGRTV